MRKKAHDSGAATSSRLEDRASKLNELDREILALADELEACVTSARNLVLREDTQAHVARFGSLDQFKQGERRRLQRMLRAWRGIRDEDGAPYRDARMLLTAGILFFGDVVREWEPQQTAMIRERAEACASVVVSHYPLLADRMREPASVDAIHAAMVCSRNPKRHPWKLIAATWDGIEAERRDAERWRVDWAEYRKRARIVDWLRSKG